MHKPWHPLRYLHMSDTGLCHRGCQSRHWPGMLSTASTSDSCRLQCMYLRPMLDSQMLHTDSSRLSSVSCREKFQMCHPSLHGWRPIISLARLSAVGDLAFLAALLKAREIHSSAGTLESTARSLVIYDMAQSTCQCTACCLYEALNLNGYR
jgi:hypothetical protein